MEIGKLNKRKRCLTNNELEYNSDYENVINDINDIKINQNMYDMLIKLSKKIDTLEKKINNFNNLENKIISLDKKIENIDKKFDNIFYEKEYIIENLKDEIIYIKSEFNENKNNSKYDYFN